MRQTPVPLSHEGFLDLIAKLITALKKREYYLVVLIIGWKNKSGQEQKSAKLC